MRISKTAAAIVCVAALSACTTGGEKGNPTPASPTAGTTGSDQSNEVPARPKSLQLDSVDTCKLLTEDQMKQISVLSSQPENLDLVDGKQSPACHYSNEARYIYAVGAVTHDGVSYWLKGAGNVTTKVVKVADYGAVKIELSGGSGFDCSISVDVADGQQLMVSYIPMTTGEKDQAVLCEKAEKAAGLALATLKTLK
ncbi:DUF3558 domain-containing protein [Lentzea sp. NPDC060358]|uniref:DUF3558 domain-containing protein n=1 Tax=Lentzea sp. NPDC060358 TaxID=3347103 RepID=UPI003665D6B0